MKIVFAATPKFAIPTLKALLDSEHTICAVYTQPDRPAGRGLKITATEVKKFALSNNLPVFQPKTFKDSATLKQLQKLQPDIFIDVACGLFVPKQILDLPKYGCINLHPSLLPRWRGAAPIPRAILAGDAETGITIMQMDKNLDTGAILKQQSIAISDSDTAATLSEKLSQIGAKLLLQVLQKLELGVTQPIPQDEAKATYAAKITKQEARINWQDSAEKIEKMIRAFNPWPIAHTKICDKNLRIWQTEIVSETKVANSAGTIMQVSKNGIDVATGKGILRLLQIQLPGKKTLPVAEIIKGYRELFNEGKLFD